jgi:hypothetical protein
MQIYSYLISLPFKYFFARLNAKQSSQVVELSQTSLMATQPPTAIARDLLQINKKPCILFIEWSAGDEHVIREAESLSLRTQSLQNVNSLLQFFESSVVPGDAAHSQTLSEWHQVKFRELKEVSSANHIFDPTVLVVNIIRNLVKTLDTVNRLAVAQKNILIPLAFVRSWAASFEDCVTKDETTTLTNLTL